MRDHPHNPPAPDPSVTIRPLGPDDLSQCAPLAARRFGFADIDQVPPHLVQTIAMYGGIALGAFDGARLVGYATCFPALRARQPFLLLFPLVVDAQFESRGIATSLMLAHRRHALDAGYTHMRWTTNSLASGPLNVYLNKLGARLTGLHENLYLTAQHPTFPDEVRIEWDLRRFPPPGRQHPCPQALTTTTTAAGDGLRTLVGGVLPARELASRPAFLVEIPWDRDALWRADPAAADHWVIVVRGIERSLLDSGYLGTAMVVDGAERRSFVQFQHPDADADPAP